MSITSRRNFLGVLATSALASSCITNRNTTRTGRGSPSRPNFIVIFTDDQGFADVGCYGARGFKTPNLDRMAQEGVKFNQFYAAASICTPSRAALMTGCYPLRVGQGKGVLYPNDTTGLEPGQPTIPNVLKKKGYATACIGKWHLGHLPRYLPTRHGFDCYYGIPYSNDMNKEEKGYPPVPLMRNEKIIEQPVNQDTLTRRYTQEAIHFIRASADQPFFLYLAHTMPHIPLHASDKFEGSTARGLYGDVIEEIDWSTGEILKTLKEEGLDENTLVIFTSDNGPWLQKGDQGGSADPLRGGKFSVWEGGMREPCIMRWPGHIPAGSVCNELATTMDLMPTLASLASASIPEGFTVDGGNMASMLTSPASAKSTGDIFLYFRPHGQLGAVRNAEGWKYHFKQKALYYLPKDIAEENNVASQHPEVIQRLKRSARQYHRKILDDPRASG